MCEKDTGFSIYFLSVCGNKTDRSEVVGQGSVPGAWHLQLPNTLWAEYQCNLGRMLRSAILCAYSVLRTASIPVVSRLSNFERNFIMTKECIFIIEHMEIPNRKIKIIFKTSNLLAYFCLYFVSFNHHTSVV